MIFKNFSAINFWRNCREKCKCNIVSSNLILLRKILIKIAYLINYTVIYSALKLSNELMQLSYDYLLFIDW